VTNETVLAEEFMIVFKRIDGSLDGNVVLTQE